MGELKMWVRLTNQEYKKLDWSVEQEKYWLVDGVKNVLHMLEKGNKRDQLKMVCHFINKVKVK